MPPESERADGKKWWAPADPFFSSEFAQEHGVDALLADERRWREIALALASDTIRVIGGEEGPWRVHDCRGPWTGRRDSHQSRESACLAWHAWHAQRHAQPKEPT